MIILDRSYALQVDHGPLYHEYAFLMLGGLSTKSPRHNIYMERCCRTARR